MLKKPWLTASAVSLLAIILVACGQPAATSTTTQSTTTPPNTSTVPTTTTQPSNGAPKYGGSLTYLVPSDITGFDEAFYAPWLAWTTHLTEDEMLNGDWTKGVAGTGQYTWILEGIYNWDSKAGSLVESWDIPSPEHWIMHVRKGVRFGVNTNSDATKLTAGREMTADDIIYSYNRQRNEPSSYLNNSPQAYLMKAMKFVATDKYTIDMQVPNDPESLYNIAQVIVDWGGVVAKEVIDKYGNMKDWKVAHGTGPFFMTDYVPASSVSFIRNPNYWDKDPIGAGKGNQLPYVDGVKFLIIGDTSTQLAALRTAKIDSLSNVQVDDATSVKQTTPDLTFKDYVPSGAYQIYMRTDKQDMPYKDLRVRQALTMGIDYPSLVKDMMKGKAAYPSFPITPMDDLKDAYLPISQASQAAEDLYKYSPAKAKQLLKDAGYPNGFKATIISSNIPNWNADYLSVIKQMWSKIGVDLNISLVEQGVYTNRWVARNYDDMFFASTASSGTFRYMVGSWGDGGGYNLSYITDPRVGEAKQQMMSLFSQNKDAEVAKANRAISQIIYENAWVINTPVENRTTFWWPWLKNYHGELAVGVLNSWGWNKWVWADQTLKKTMGR